MPWWELLRASGWLYPLFLGALGAVAGSFASMAIHRIPREGLSPWRPLRSFCPACRRTLPWHENLPILGWLLLRGRCRGCGARISLAYLLHELVLAGLFVLAGHSWAAVSPVALALLLLALTGLWIAAAVDWRHLILPDGITLGGIPFGFLASALVPRFQIWDPARAQPPLGTAWLGLDPVANPVLAALASAAAGCLLAGGVLFGFRALFSYLLRQEALGLGDVKYLAAVGALLGLEGALWTFLVGILAGSLLGVLNIARMVALVARRRRRRGVRRSFRDTLVTGWRLGRTIPFGPALILGTILVLLAPLTVRHFFLVSWPAWLQHVLA